MLNVVNLESGTKMVASYGAMFPTMEGEVLTNNNGVLQIRWDNPIEGMPELQEVPVRDVSFGRSVNGSPIGIFPETVFAQI